MYKLVFLDLDGTTLNSEGKITEYTHNIIKQTMKKNVDIIIVTGRPIESAKNFAKEINSQNYFIAGNGAIIYDIQKDEIIYKKTLSKKKILEIIKICEENSIFYSIYTYNSIIAKSLNHNMLFYYKENLKKEDSKKTKINIVPDMYEYIENTSGQNFLKIAICDEDLNVFNSIIKKFSKIKEINILDTVHRSRKIIENGTEEVPLEYFYSEILADNVDKWNAINHLISILKINKKEIIAIGDNINDKKMIENAGLGIAMGQSTPKIIEIADFITQNNNEEGVAKALAKFIIEK